ncbi:ABC transporter permease subunit [Bradyrhizobium sp. WSM471]|uniref:ABC transporter permease subunit n=1 Tax=Bradyrhizobium sp. WSM471 TaxID=319017 RepID=UPI0012F77594|nr:MULTISPECIES: ABC transporter permease [Bradyrhizobium]UFW43146.1 ABC transporter permease [Bradyrhizobium canariense]
MSVLLAVILSLRAGTASVIYCGRFADYRATVLSVAAVAMLGCWCGVITNLLLGMEPRWLPVQDYVPFSDCLPGGLALLPAMALAVTSCALLMRQTRSVMLEVVAEDYVGTARAKSMPNVVVIWIHWLRNALLPVMTLLGLQIGQIFAGAVVITSRHPRLEQLSRTGDLSAQFFGRAGRSSVLGAGRADCDIICAWLVPGIRYGV